MSIRKEMSGIYAHRQMGPAQTSQTGRLYELLESLKSEFENATQELSNIRNQKEEFEYKCNPFSFVYFVLFCFVYVYFVLFILFYFVYVCFVYVVL